MLGMTKWIHQCIKIIAKKFLNKVIWKMKIRCLVKILLKKSISIVRDPSTMLGMTKWIHQMTFVMSFWAKRSAVEESQTLCIEQNKILSLWTTPQNNFFVGNSKRGKSLNFYLVYLLKIFCYKSNECKCKWYNHTQSKWSYCKW